MRKQTMTDFKWFDRRLKLITDSQVFKNVNNGTPYVTTFSIGEWTVIKELFLAYYAPSYINILKKRGKSLNYVDLFSGSGVVNLKGLRINFPGSPLIVSSLIKRRFDKYYFSDVEKDKINQLKTFLKGGDYYFYPEDANTAMRSVVGEIGQKENHSLIFIDPNSMQIHFDSIKKLKDVACDLIMTFPSEEILRAIEQWRNNPSLNTPKLDSFYGDNNWKNEIDWNNIESSSLNAYVQRIFKYADKTRASGFQVEKTLGGHHYFVILVSTGGALTDGSFHRILGDFNKRIQSIDGKYVRNFMNQYTIGKSRPIDEWSPNQ